MADANPMDLMGSFDTENDAKSDPLVPQGSFIGRVTKAAFASNGESLVLSVALNENGKMCTDGETPVDGITMNFFIRLPIASHKGIKTASGKQDKWQWEVNSLAKAAKDLMVDLATPEKIKGIVETAVLVGMDVTLAVEVDEYMGNIRNQVRSVKVRNSTGI